MKRIAFIGASGYGNIGDDIYPIVFKRHLSNRVKLSFYNSDLPASRPSADVFVFGGGGLIWHEEGNAHFEYMKKYADWAKEQGIPYIFISCGIQPRHDYSPNNKRWETAPIRKWVPLLNQSSGVIVRSEEGMKILRSMGVKSVGWAPDAAYLYKIKEQESVVPGMRLWIPAASARAKNKELVKRLKREQDEGNHIVIMNMGGPGTDFVVDEAMAEIPTARALYAKDLSPNRCMRLIQKAEFVYTGRYHGLVLSRVAGTPYWANFKHAQFKIENENCSADIGRAIKNIRAIERML